MVPQRQRGHGGTPSDELPASTAARSAPTNRAPGVAALDVQQGPSDVSAVKRPACAEQHVFDAALVCPVDRLVDPERPPVDLRRSPVGPAGLHHHGTVPDARRATRRDVELRHTRREHGGVRKRSPSTAAPSRCSTRCYSTRGDVTVAANTLTVTNVHPYRNIPCPEEPPVLQRSQRTFDDRLDRLFSGTATWSIENRILAVSASGVRR